MSQPLDKPSEMPTTSESAPVASTALSTPEAPPTLSLDVDQHSSLIAEVDCMKLNCRVSVLPSMSLKLNCTTKEKCTPNEFHIASFMWQLPHPDHPTLISTILLNRSSTVLLYEYSHYSLIAAESLHHHTRTK